MKYLLVIAAFVTSLASAATLTPIQLLNPAGSTANQTILSTGPSTAPAWGSISFSVLPTIPTNTVLGNPTSATASPTSIAVPGCSTASSALQWTTNTGFGCNTAINASTLGGTAASSYALLASPAFTGTATFVNLSASGTFTPSQTSGIVGTTTANNANAGSVGEYLTYTTGPTSITSATNFNGTSGTLTAGDWDVECTMQTTPAGTTTTSQISAGVSTTSLTFGALGASAQYPFAVPAGVTAIVPTPVVRLSLSASVTVYCVGQIAFATSTMQASAFIRARRVR